MSLNQAGHGARALKAASEYDGAKGALSGAIGVALIIAAALGTVGLMLTPIGLLLLLIVGGIAGGLGLFKKARNHLTH